MEIKSPVNGTIKKLSSLKDGVFSKNMMGQGVCIEHESKTVYSPIKGKLEVVFETGHAYGIKGKDGTFVLVHIGLDTVNLKGKGFEKLVKQGKKVKVNAPLCNLDYKFLDKQKYNTDVIVVVTNESKTKIDVFESGKTTIKDNILITK